MCEGNCINYSDVTAWFVEIVKQAGLTIAWIYYDSYSAKYWVQEMTGEGFNMERCIQGGKGREAMRNLKDKKIILYKKETIKDSAGFSTTVYKAIHAGKL